MAPDLLLPLFPLEVVLLPLTTLPLHIFEERYKLMVGEAIEQKSEFGIVLAKGDSLANVGCTASVERVTQRYEDGRLDIVTVGRRRFEILFLDQQKPYLQAGVHFFEDDPGAEPAPEASRRLDELFEHVRAFLPRQGQAEPEHDAGSFPIAGILPLDLELKQRLLAMRSEADRTAALNEHLEKLIPRLARARKMEKSARGNGHGG